MKEFIEKLIERLKEEKQRLRKLKNDTITLSYNEVIAIEEGAYNFCKKIINELAEEYNNGWIPCSDKLPTVEEKVLIFAKRKYRGGSFKYIITTAMYEDGTVLENDSKWRWEDIEAEWDEEEDCYIIPEGWWEDKAYNPDGALNYAIYDEVIAWQPLPQPYKEGCE